MTDSFRADYQDTVDFRQAIEYNLKQLLAYTASTQLSKASSSAPASDAIHATVAPMETDGALSYIYEAPAESIGQEVFPLSPSDLNLLYAIWVDGNLLLHNSEALSPNGALPDGYNFKLWFDGKTVSIQKDGADIDVYGDGYYRAEDGDWDVYGYRNQSVPESYSRIQIYLAAAKEPVVYSGSYQYGGLYEVAQNQIFLRSVLIWLLLVPLGAGVLLTAWSILWHKHKVRADQAIARFAGCIWWEVRLLLLVPLLFLCALTANLCYSFLFYTTFQTFSEYLMVFLVLWWGYLFLNDLRYNFGRLRTQSFCAAFRRLVHRKELHWSVQQRIDRRMLWQFSACIPFFLFCLLSVPFLYIRYLYASAGPILLLFFCLAGAALIALQVLLLRQNRTATADLGLLLDRIEAAGAGRLDTHMPLPADSDLCAAAEQLDHIESGLRTALEEQMKSERMKVELIANVSHDLKTPLTSIISYTELLKQEEGLPDHVNDYISILIQKAQRLQTMVKEVFEVSKAASGNLPIDRKVLDLGKLLQQTLADMNEEVACSCVTLKLQLPETPVFINSDGDRLYRVFQNLIQNALKYSLDGSRVYLSLETDDGRAHVMVRNISRDELPTGVDFTARFVRGDQSRTDGGSGLGLSIASTFTEACGGSFAIRTEADLFTALVSFPLTDHRPTEEDLT